MLSVINVINKSVKAIICSLYIVFSICILNVQNINAVSNPINTSILVNDKSDTTRLNFLKIEIRKYTNNLNTIDTARSLINEAISIVEKGKIDLPFEIELARYEYYITIRDFRKANELNVIIGEKLKGRNINSEIEYHSLAANHHLSLGLFREAINLYQKSINEALDHNVKGVIPKLYEGLSDVYQTIGDYKEVELSFQKMLETSIQENDFQYTHKAYIRLGDLSRRNRDYQMATFFYNKSLNLAENAKDTSKIIRSIRSIAWHCYKQNKLDSSLYWYNKMLQYAVSIGDNTQLANALGNIAYFYLDKDFEKAEEYLKKGLMHAEKASDWYEMAGIYRLLSSLYKSRNDFEKAYYNYVLFKQYNDSLQKYTVIRGLPDSKLRYKAQAKEDEFNELSLKIQKQRYLIYGVSVLLFFMLLTGFLLLRQWRLKSQRHLSEVNQKISEITQANLRQQMNPHFVFNTLNSIQYYMYQNDKLSTNNYLTKFSGLMRKILENSQHTTISLCDELDAVQLYIELEAIRFKNKFDFEINVDEEIDTFMYKIPSMLIQPYVENAICHGLMHRSEKGLLKINISMENSHLSCLIIDNGIGREAANEIKKNKARNHQPLGIKITESRIDLINALYGTNLKTIYVDLKDDEGNSAGTSVEIQIPILT